MTTRRDLLACAAALAASGTAAAAENHVETIHRQALPGPFEGWEAEFVEVTMAPGKGSAPHQHPGFVLGYVVEGQFRFGLDDKPPQVLNAGQTFYEAPGAHHTVSASASATRPAKILAIIISQKKAAG